MELTPDNKHKQYHLLLNHSYSIVFQVITVNFLKVLISEINIYLNLV